VQNVVPIRLSWRSVRDRGVFPRVWLGACPPGSCNHSLLMRVPARMGSTRVGAGCNGTPPVCKDFGPAWLIAKKKKNLRICKSSGGARHGPCAFRVRPSTRSCGVRASIESGDRGASRRGCCPLLPLLIHDTECQSRPSTNEPSCWRASPARYARLPRERHRSELYQLAVRSAPWIRADTPPSPALRAWRFEFRNQPCPVSSFLAIFHVFTCAINLPDFSSRYNSEFLILTPYCSHARL